MEWEEFIGSGLDSVAVALLLLATWRQYNTDVSPICEAGPNFSVNGSNKSRRPLISCQTHKLGRSYLKAAPLRDSQVGNEPAIPNAVSKPKCGHNDLFSPLTAALCLQSP